MCARLWIQQRCSRHACTLRQCAHGHTVVALACAHTSHLPPDLVQPATPRGGLRGAGCSCWLAHFFPARRDTFQLAQRWGPGSGSQAWPTTRWCREHRLRTPELWVPELGMGVWGGRRCSAVGAESLSAHGRLGTYPSLPRVRTAREQRLLCLLPSPQGEELSFRMELQVLPGGPAWQAPCGSRALEVVAFYSLSLK